MSWQNMSFSKCSHLEAKKLQSSKSVIKEITSRTMIFNKQYVENEAFKMGFTLLKIKLVEKFKLKIKLTETKI